MICEKCGTELPEDSLFCDNCGASVEPKAVAAEAAAEQEGTPPVAPPPPKKKKTGCIIAAIVTAIVVVVLALLPVVIIAGGGVLVAGTFFMPTLGNKVPVTVSPVETVSATEPVETVYGLPDSNPYAAVFRKYDAYILPESGSEYLSYSRLTGLSQKELELAVMEITARHGAFFSNGDAQAYFEARDWYASSGVAGVSLNEYEMINMEVLRVYRNKQDGSLYNSGNPYTPNFRNQDYAVRDSNQRYLCAEDVKYLTAEQLVIARNEIYARHGVILTTPELQDYFYAKEWYVPKVPVDQFPSGNLNRYETGNIQFIQLYEKRLEGVSFSADNPYSSTYYKYYGNDYIFPESSVAELSQYQLMGMTQEDLVIARNEIYARNGYSFSSDHLMEYFLQTPWYFPNTPVGDTAAVQFNEVEKANIALIKQQENQQESGNTQQSGAIRDDDYTFRKQWTYGTACYHIPVVQISGVNATEINARMYEIYYKRLEEYVFCAGQDDLFLLGLVYTVGRKGDVVSVMVKEIWEWDMDEYAVYNFSASTGRSLSDAEVFSAYNINESQGRAKIRTALEKHWADMEYEVPGWAKDEFFDEQKANTLKDSNINAVMPYVAADGSLQFAGTIYSVAGADSYMHRFDEYGNILQLECNIH